MGQKRTLFTKYLNKTRLSTIGRDKSFLLVYIYTCKMSDINFVSAKGMDDEKKEEICKGSNLLIG